MLEFAVLGLLSEGPLHGYELRKRLSERLGWARRVSFGSLYPTLRRLQADGLVTASDTHAAQRLGVRNKVVYEITGEGKERFTELLAEAGPQAWEDDAFGVHVAFLTKTDRMTRIRLLEGRRGRLEERREGMREGMSRVERMDRYTLGLQQLGLDAVEREVRWLSELIDEERAVGPTAVPAHPNGSTQNSSTQNVVTSTTPAPPAPTPISASPQSPESR